MNDDFRYHPEQPPVEGASEPVTRPVYRPQEGAEYNFNSNRTNPNYGDPDYRNPNFGYSYSANACPGAEQTQRVEPAMRKKKEKKGLTAGKLIALALCCSLLGGILGAGGVYLLTKDRLADAEPPKAETQILQGSRETAAVNVAAIDTNRVLTLSEVYARNVNSTVGITTSITTTNFWGYQTEAAAAGSGFILTADGYILTNFHVIEGSKSVTVTTFDGTAYDAKIIGYDESNDIAVLKIEATDLVPVVLGDSDTLSVGDTVAAIGNPLGELTFSLTQGAVSALDRTVTFSTGMTMELIQTDCAINSGNSGGALFNLYGEVVGITNAKYSSASSSSASIDNIGFAIPINAIRSIVTSIIENGYIVKPYIGVTVRTVSAESITYGLPQGAAVKTVEEGSPAEEAGLMENDIITKANGTAVTGSNDLVAIVRDAQIGDELELEFYRKGETRTVKLTVGEQTLSALEPQEESDPQEDRQQQQGGYFDPYDFFRQFGFGG